MTTVSIDGLLLDETSSEVTLDGGRYVVVGRVGAGGMARVYRGWDVRLGVWRAIKLLTARRSSSKTALLRFEREARVMARLDHPCVVRVYDHDWHGDRPYIAMELVAGGSLWDWMERHRMRLPVRDSVRAMIAVCEALSVAHARGVVHRDVKPNNVLIAEGGQYKLTDFGVALLEGQARERRGSRLGTEGFHPPEQGVDPGRVDARADVYGVGATLYAIASGQRPKSLHDADDDPSRLRGLPRILRPVVRRATAWDPADRHQDVLELMRDLDTLLYDLPERAPDLPPIFERQVSDRAAAEVPTAPTAMARHRRRNQQADTVPLPHVRVGRDADFGQGPREPSLDQGAWPSESEVAAGTVGFAVGAAVIALVGGLFLVLFFG